jgi:putative transposase
VTVTAAIGKPFAAQYCTHRGGFVPRTARRFFDGLPYHVLNRGNRRQAIFSQAHDYEVFLTTLADALERVPLAILAFALMPNHFHLVMLPERGVAISEFMRWFMNAHIRRYHRFRELWGTGHLYQGRFKAFAVQGNHHLLTVLRYVEANALTARLVPTAEEWEWSSLSRRASEDGRDLLAPSPVPRPANWLEIVNRRLPLDVLDELRTANRRQIAFGDPEWVRMMTKRSAAADETSLLAAHS